MKDQSIPSWSLPSALAVGGAGFSVLVVSLLLMYSIGKTAYSMLHFSVSEGSATTTIVSCVIAVGAGALVARWLANITLSSLWQSVEWRPSGGKTAFLGFLGFLGFFLMKSAMTGEMISPPWNVQITLPFILAIVSTVLVQPLMEELYFRGILYAGLTSKMGWLPSIVIVTLLFVMVHGLYQWVYILPLSIALAFVRVGTKSTANCFALHAAYNLGVVMWAIG